MEGVYEGEVDDDDDQAGSMKRGPECHLGHYIYT